MSEMKNLSQRLSAVRAEIGFLEQKKYGAELKYPYVKIFDIYRDLKPALQKHGVDFDVVDEVATRRDANGNPEYWTILTVKGKYGDRNVYVYESDITLLFTNIDDPTDERRVKIHALGTNDGGIDKAKGSAWTYALKYYFFERLCADQGEDDPDNKQSEPIPEIPIPKTARDACNIRMPYGKHEGKFLGDVWKLDKAYFNILKSDNNTALAVAADLILRAAEEKAKKKVVAEGVIEEAKEASGAPVAVGDEVTVKDAAGVRSGRVEVVLPNDKRFILDGGETFTFDDLGKKVIK